MKITTPSALWLLILSAGPVAGHAQCLWGENLPSLTQFRVLPNGNLAFAGGRTEVRTAAGGLLWLNDAPAQALATDTAGNVYVGGSFADSVYTAGQWMLGQPGANLFIQQLGPDGSLKWFFSQAGGDGAQGFANQVNSLQCHNGLLFAAGYFQGTMVFGPDTLQSLGAAPDGFVAWLTASGAPLGGLGFGGFGPDRVNGLAIGPAGDVHVAGLITDSARVGGIWYYANRLTNPLGTFQFEDAFVARMDTLGFVAWAKTLGSQQQSLCPTDEAIAIQLTDNGDVVVGGHMGPYADFADTTLQAGHPCSPVAFLAGYDSLGNLRWVHQLGDTSVAANASVRQLWATPQTQQLGVGGTFKGANAVFGSATLASNSLSNDLCMLLVDSAGTLSGLEAYGGVGYDAAVGMGWGVGGAKYYAGIYNQAMDVQGYGFSAGAGFNTGFLLGAVPDSLFNQLGLPASVDVPACGDTAFLPVPTPALPYAWVPGTHISFVDSGYAIMVTATTELLLTVDAHGCQFADSVSVNVPKAQFGLDFIAADSVQFGPPPYTVAFQNLTPDTAAFQFHWAFGDGVQAQAVSPVHTYTQPGIYSIGLLAIAVGTGCSDTLYKPFHINLADSVVALPTNGVAAGIQVWPNPASQQLRVRVPQPSQLALLNAMGRVLAKQHLIAGENSCPLSDFEPGLYVLRIEPYDNDDNSARAVVRIIIE